MKKLPKISLLSLALAMGGMQVALADVPADFYQVTVSNVMTVTNISIDNAATYPPTSSDRYVQVPASTIQASKSGTFTYKLFYGANKLPSDSGGYQIAYKWTDGQGHPQSCVFEYHSYGNDCIASVVSGSFCDKSPTSKDGKTCMVKFFVGGH